MTGRSTAARGWGMAIGGLLCLAGLLPARAEPPRVLVAEQADIELRGSSNLHRWRCAGSRLDADLRMPGGAEAWNLWFTAVREDRPPPEGQQAPSIKARFRIEDLACPQDRMKRDLLRAVRVERYPEVVYEVIGIEGPPLREAGGDTLEADVLGRLSLAGVTLPVTHRARVRMLEPHTMEVEGTMSLNMRTFGIEPPVALLGLLRAHADFEVWYRLRTGAYAKTIPSTVGAAP